MSNQYSFRLKHSTADLSVVAGQIPLNVARMWRFADPRFTPDGVPLPRKYKNSYCIFKLPEEIDSPTEAIHLIRDIMLKCPDLMMDFSSSSIEKSIYCTIDGEGELLVGELQVLCELDINLEID